MYVTSGYIYAQQATTPWVVGDYPNQLYSTTTNLTASQALNSGSIFVYSYSQIDVMIFTSHDSVTGGLVFEHSTDASNWFPFPAPQKVLAMASGQGWFVSIPKKFNYFRVRYTNGAVATTTFRMVVW